MSRALRVLLWIGCAGCAPAAMTVTADHPAHPDAPTGRLAGPPPALRVAVEPAKPAEAAHEHHHHHQEPKPGTEPKAETDHSHHQGHRE